MESQLDAVWTARPEVLTFHFGLPDAKVIEKAHSLNISFGVCATSVEEAAQIVEHGADFVVAQGYEAGGRRGTWLKDSELPTLELVQQIRTAFPDIPIAAAGGIMNGKDIERALDAGSDAVWMGTGFMSVAETSKKTGNIHLQVIQENVEKSKLLGDQLPQQTTVTPCFTGIRARAIENQFVKAVHSAEEHGSNDPPILPFPHQYYATAPFRATNDKEYLPLLTGAGYTNCRFLTVQELMIKLSEEFQQATKQYNDEKAKSEL